MIKLIERLEKEMAKSRAKEIKIASEQAVAFFKWVRGLVADVAKLTGELTEARSGKEEEVREPVRLFAVEMEARLKENDHKGGWEGLTAEHLLERAQDNLTQLRSGADQSVLVATCADVANYAMMLASQAVKK
jgi:hypothetical protein